MEGTTVDHDPTDDLQSDQLSSDLAGRAPYPTRMRVILILSLMSWMVVALAVAWAMRLT